MTNTPPAPPAPVPAPTDPPTLPAPEPTPPTDPPVPGDKKPDRFAEERRRADAAEKRAKDAETALAERDRKEAEDNGEWEKVANQNASERDAEKAENNRLKAERKVERIANKAIFNPVKDSETEETTHSRFINPDEALALLPDSTDLTNDDAVTEALHTLATQRPHLMRSEVNAPAPAPTPANTPSGGPGGTQPGGKPKLTREYVEGLSVQEIQKLTRERTEEMAALRRGS